MVVSFLEHLDDAIAAAGESVTPMDSAVVHLARTYAAELDGPDADLVKVGPLLLGTLDRLGLTPRARTATTTTGGHPDVAVTRNPLDELRARRRARTADPA